MRLLTASAVLLFAALGSAHAEGDALVDMLGPREIAVGEAMRGGATGSSAIGLNPAGLPLNRELVFEGGYGYRASRLGVARQRLGVRLDERRCPAASTTTTPARTPISTA